MNLRLLPRCPAAVYPKRMATAILLKGMVFNNDDYKRIDNRRYP